MSSTPIWALLGLSCVCLLFRNTIVHADGKAEDGKAPELTLKPQGRPNRYIRPQSYTFPIVIKGGVRYYDLAGAEETEIHIHRNNQGVQGITASHKGCKVNSCFLGVAYQLDEELFINCPQLNFTLQGRWPCAKEGLLLQRRGVAVNMTLAKCKDVWNNIKNADTRIKYSVFGMKEGVQKLVDAGISNCSAQMCVCKWYFGEDSYTVNVYCEKVGLTDDMLPTLPMKLNVLMLGWNNLRSMDKLVKHLLPHSQTLGVLRLDHNQMEVLPSFPSGTFPHLVDISLVSNKIKKVDIEAFRELIIRKNLIINMEGNTFPCDCLLYRFKVFLLKHYVCHWHSLKTYMDMKCNYEGENRTEVIYALPEDICGRAAWWQVDRWLLLNITLGVLNLLVIGIMIDLICILTNTGCSKERRPVMDRVLCGLRGKLCLLSPMQVGYIED